MAEFGLISLIYDIYNQYKGAAPRAAKKEPAKKPAKKPAPQEEEKGLLAAWLYGGNTIAVAPAPFALAGCSQKTSFYEEAVREASSPQDIHWKLLEKNWDYRIKTQKKATKKTIELLDNSLGLVEGEPDSPQNILFTASRKTYFQAENSVMLDASEKCIDMFYINRGDLYYLKKAEEYIRHGLANPENYLSFDIYRFSAEDVFSPTIHPTEEYFELKLALYQVYSITQPKLALQLSTKIEKELDDPRIVQAQRANVVSARGYKNRLYVLRGFAGIYNPEIDTEEEIRAALADTEKAHLWANEQYQKNSLALSVWGMNKKDLRYDTLLSKVIMGRLHVKLGGYDKAEYDQAAECFQWALSQPEAVVKEDGFLDIGLQALYGLIHLSLITAGSLKEAGRNFEKNINWALLSTHLYLDLRESLGMVIKDGDEIISEIKFSDRKTPEERLALLMRLIDYVEIPFDQRSEIVNIYRMLKAQGG